MNNVFPESMNQLPDDPREAIKVMENYIRYMSERLDFAFRRERGLTEVPEAEVVERLTRLEVKETQTANKANSAYNMANSAVSGLDTKVDKVTGKQLSTNDYDNTSKTKLDGLADIETIGSGLSLNNGTLTADAQGSGHIILNENGTSMAQRSKLQFENCTVTDDSVNDKTIVTASEGMGFVIANRTLTFSNNIATVSDSRVTSSTYATLYFHDGCLASAVNAGLSIDTSTGTITITADSAPSSSLTCDIVCENGTGGGSVSSLIAELRDDVDAIDAEIGSTSISGIGDGTLTGAISAINNNLSKKVSKIYSNPVWQSFFDIDMPDNELYMFLILSAYDAEAEVLLVTHYADNNLSVARISGQYLSISRVGVNVGRVTTSQTSGFVRGLSVLSL